MLDSQSDVQKKRYYPAVFSISSYRTVLPGNITVYVHLSAAVEFVVYTSQYFVLLLYSAPNSTESGSYVID